MSPEVSLTPIVEMVGFNEVEGDPTFSGTAAPSMCSQATTPSRCGIALVSVSFK